MLFIFGIFLSLFCPLFGIIWAVLYFLQCRRSGFTAIIMGIAFASAFFGYIPDANSDINRHILWLSNYVDIPVTKCFNAGHYKQLYIWDLWNWIIAHFGNTNLLQSSGAFVGFSITSYVVFDVANHNNLGKRDIIALVFLEICILPAFDICLGIRYCNAFIISSLAYYCYIKKKKLFTPLLLLLVGCLIHRATFLLVILFLVLHTTKKFNYRIINISIFAITGIMSMLSVYILRIFPSSGNIMLQTIREAIQEAAIASNDTRSWYVTQAASLNTRVNQLWGYGLFLLLLVRIRFTIYWQKKLNEDVDEEYLLATNAANIIFSACLGLSISFTMNGQRYITPSLLLLMVADAYRRANCPLKKNTSDQLIELFINVWAFGLLLLHVYSLGYGNASGWSLFTGLIIGLLNI